MAQVALRNIVKMFDKTPAVQGIDLDIADREFIVLVGPSGCGKSTTLRMIAGLEEATSGVTMNHRPFETKLLDCSFELTGALCRRICRE